AVRGPRDSPPHLPLSSHVHPEPLLRAQRGTGPACGARRGPAHRRAPPTRVDGPFAQPRALLRLRASAADGTAAGVEPFGARMGPGRRPVRDHPDRRALPYLSAMTDDRHVEPLGAAVAFPVHDTRLVKLEQDDAVLARELAERDGPSGVCLHPGELDRPEKLRVWGAHGHRVVSAGERRDPQFLGRILRLVRGARRVVSNQLSTAVVYAAAEGAPTAIYGSDLSIGALGTEVSQRTRDLWPEFHEGSDDETRRDIALAELGHQHLLTPEALRAALGWDRRSPGPFLSYWTGAPLRKAGAVLGLVQRT